MESQISLPRSYTLPREFKYSKKPRARKVVRPEMFASTNSSDGGLSREEDEEEDTGFLFLCHFKGAVVSAV